MAAKVKTTKYQLEIEYTYSLMSYSQYVRIIRPDSMRNLIKVATFQCLLFVARFQHINPNWTWNVEVKVKVN